MRISIAQIRETILRSQPSDWNQVDTEKLLVILYLRDDVNLRIELNLERGEDDEIAADWAMSFEHSDARAGFVDIYYNATLIARPLLVWVDLGRALLPRPDERNRTFKAFDYKIAEVCDFQNSLREYIEAAGLGDCAVRDTD